MADAVERISPRSCAALCLAEAALWRNSVLRFWMSEGLTQQNLNMKGWNLYVRREFPRKLESRSLSREIPSRGFWAYAYDSLRRHLQALRHLLLRDRDDLGGCYYYYHY